MVAWLSVAIACRRSREGGALLSRRSTNGARVAILLHMSPAGAGEERHRGDPSSTCQHEEQGA